MEGFGDNPLVARRVVEIIDRTFRIYRDNFVTFVSLAALVMVPITLIVMFVEANSPPEFTTIFPRGFSEEYQGEPLEVDWALVVAGAVTTFLQAVLVNGLVTVMASENHLGRKPSVAEGFAQARDRFVPLALGLLVSGVMLAGAAFLLAVLTLLLYVPIVVFPVVIYFGIAIYLFIFPVMMLERVGVAFGARRALMLCKARFWPVFGLSFGILVITLTLSIIFSALVSAIFNAGGVERDILRSLAEMAANIFTAPILPIGLTLMYYDTRIRLEGLDITLQMVETPNPRPSDLVSPEVPGRLIGSRDLVNILILTVGVFAVFCVLGVIISLIAVALSPGY
jgi:hypothetical protein